MLHLNLKSGLNVEFKPHLNQSLNLNPTSEYGPLARILKSGLTKPESKFKLGFS